MWTVEEASKLVSAAEKTGIEDNKHCYMLQIIFSSVYGGGLSCASYKKLPRLINGIPLGPGKMTQSQADAIIWRYMEGCGDIHTFVSIPITQEDARNAHVTFRSLLQRQAKAVFGDVTVKTNTILSRCIALDANTYLNDVASDDGLCLSFSD